MPDEWVSSLPRSNRLESVVTNGRAVWILDVTFNVIKRSLKIAWTSNPEFLSTDGHLTFERLVDYSMTYHDGYENDCLAQLIGFDEYLDSGVSRFVICTTNWEMRFASAEHPRLV